MKSFTAALVFMTLLSAYLNKVQADDWTVLEGSAYALTFADWAQTRQIRKRDDIEETNSWICGKNPSEDCVSIWMLTKLGYVYWLNNEYKVRNVRNVWGIKVKSFVTGVYVGTHVYAVGSNYINFNVKVEW